MVKIEKLSQDAVVEFTRNGKVHTARVGSTLSKEELDTLKVRSGSVVYSIDELELVTKAADETKSSSQTISVSDSVATSTSTITEVSAAAPTETVTQPAVKIIFPNKKKTNG